MDSVRARFGRFDLLERVGADAVAIDGNLILVQCARVLDEELARRHLWPSAFGRCGV